MQSVTVLTPNARRHVVKVEPNKTILWILEQACLKHNFDVEEHDLKHHNKTMDLSLMFRFSGVPNNATLEMVPVTTKRIEQNLTICLQLEDGTRLNGDFPSSTTLQQIIEKLCPEKCSPSPVVIYMRSEYHGESLNTSLRIMGLSSGGRALLRLVNTDPESLRVQANVSANLPQKPREESPERPKKSTKPETKIGTINVIGEIKKMKEVEVKVEKSESEPMEKTETKSSSNVVNEVVEKMEIVEDDHEPEPEPIINYLDDRGTIIFSLDSVKSSNVDIPDSFFDLTTNEVRNLYRELKQQVDQNDNQPLMTAAMRKLDEDNKILNQLAVYKTCTIRIQMPNRIVIQTKFKSIEKVEDLMEFLKKFLINPQQEFHLFMTPPKTILDKSETLIESNCVPSALLHFGCDTKDLNLIKDEFLEKLSSGSAATKILKQSKFDNECSEVDESQASTSSSKPPVPTNFMASKATKSTPGNVPKWFKFGK